ncbi:ABC transporter ATP-binding protein [Aureimonas leprariae]|uniref:ABC transporter ATP-binding protein n=1 Tax=Plantimonas leprariae TaxID=2615207 RepID=A0A7V7TV13_9HYPH|nr:ABC transporter ATP-binding protein [Aureimonas leprariae]KAB0677363.1 ABC transporter ATP-binding protein [Aureimonas leprariae]
MSSIRIENLTKRFGASTVLDDVSLEIGQGEFLALLGPSGCGKTTLLRLVAGFETPSAGRILFDGVPVAGEGWDVPPEARNVAIVFQSYALWPHMTVAENVGYPLRVRGVKGAARTERVAEALAAVELPGFEARRPAELSGGQRQRVALARCLAMDPAVVLLDEPLANLDVHLRASMEDIFKRFHARTGATMVYITHDQAEAMALADRIAVMDRGRIVQLDPPAKLHAEPQSERVARFIGEGRVADCRVVACENGAARIVLFGHEASVRAGAETSRIGKGRLCLRPGDLAVGEHGFEARVVSSRFAGSHAVVTVEPLADPEVRLAVIHPVPLAAGASVRVRVADGWLLPAEAAVPAEAAA